MRPSASCSTAAGGRTAGFGYGTTLTWYATPAHVLIILLHIRSFTARLPPFSTQCSPSRRPLPAVKYEHLPLFSAFLGLIFPQVPIIAQLVGYKHAGVPVRLEVSRSAKDLFESENVNALRGLIDVLAPHVMFQLGPSTVVFPVLGWDLQSFSSLRGDLASPPFPESLTQQSNASVSIGVSP